MYMLSARDGQRLWELQIGENINATPAVLDGRIYIGAFNGKLFALGPKKGEVQPPPPATAQHRIAQ
jgi:outer membrane protein assembly factor BamB